MLGCKVVGKEMARRRAGGCIINVSSLLAHRPAVGTAVYAAAKAGQLGEFLGAVYVLKQTDVLDGRGFL